MAATIRVYDPRTYPVETPAETDPVAGGEELRRSARELGVGSLVGKRIAIVDNRKLLSFGTALREQLLAQGASAVNVYDSPTYRPVGDDVLDRVVAESDAAVTGLGNCGSCTALIARDGARLRKRGLLTATLILPEFRLVAASATTAAGASGFPVLPVRPDVEFTTGDELAGEAGRVAHLILTVGG